jgi:hypothetical protein
MDQHKLNQFKQELKYYTGSERFFRHCYGRGIYTEGVQFMAESLGAYWLLDMIFIHQQEAKVSSEAFQVWVLKVDKEQNAKLILEDGNDNLIKSSQVFYTDFPLPEFTLWLVDKTLMLPSEY